MGVGTRQHSIHRKRELLPELHLTHLDVIYGRSDLIHAVARGYGHDIILARLTEYTEYEVYGLVAAVADKDILGRHLMADSRAFRRRWCGSG